ncbi:Hypothetical predicted protein [Mytilus galloprovincialis]|uniref:CARD domain-containing protein n=1 Tax=Mytilus galloprovincialis TaxID=29158 RepID=A0A8B6HCX6_MYTGA|nr:Hypothetical predicted protein [Mytilus galloprovincialis]VDI77127.1 Hypothetical predicted protein [Mytilus galloprovincialis]
MESRKEEVIVTIHMENETNPKTTELLELHKKTDTRKITVLDDEFIHYVTLDTTVMDGLISKCILTIGDREEIMKQSSLSERNRMIISTLMARPYSTFETFTEELVNFEQSKMVLVSKLRNYDCSGDSRLPSVTTKDMNNHTIQLQKNFKVLVHQLATTESIGDHLISAEILCPEDYAEICDQITKEQKNRLLLTKLMHKDADAFKCFLSVLKKDTCYEELARRIERTDVTDKDKILLQIGRTAAKKKNENTRGIQICVETENIIPKNIQGIP